MAWVTLVEQDVLDRFNQDELDAIEDAGDTVGSLDVKLTGIMAQVSGSVQGYISSCPNNTSFGAAGTIPQECLYHTVSVVKHALLASVGNLNALVGESREREYTDAMRYFERVSKCEIVVSPNSGDITTKVPAPIASGTDTKLSFAM